MNFAEKIDFLCKHFGGIGELGKIIGVSTQAIRNWKEDGPSEKALDRIKTATGIPKILMISDSLDITEELVSSASLHVSRSESHSTIDESPLRFATPRELQLERQIADANIQRLKEELTDMAEDLARIRKREAELRFAIKVLAGFLVKKGMPPEESFVEIIKFIREQGDADLASSIPWISTLMVEMGGWAEKNCPPDRVFDPKSTNGPGAPAPIFKATPDPKLPYQEQEQEKLPDGTRRQRQRQDG